MKILAHLLIFVTLGTFLLPAGMDKKEGIYVSSDERLEDKWDSQVTSSGETIRVSVASDGTEGDRASEFPVISSDGRTIAFASWASNLVTGDTNGYWDVFIRDQQTGVIERVSVSSSGTQGNEYSGGPSISANGRYVAFFSYASNLVSGDTNGMGDVFVHDRYTGTTERVSVNSNGLQGNLHSVSPSISADGRYVTFESEATNLVESDTNGFDDIFVYDRQTGLTEIVSLSTSGAQGNSWSHYPAVSSDGRFIIFSSYASNLVTSDTNSTYDIFLRDRFLNETKQVSVSSDGMQGNESSSSPSISLDGRYVVFHSEASNLVIDDTNDYSDVFLCDLQTGNIERISVSRSGKEGNQGSWSPSISTDGRYVTYRSSANNLIEDDINNMVDIFLHDRQTGETELVSVSSSGIQTDKVSINSGVSQDGRFIVFDSYATNLVTSDTNNTYDVFVHDRCPDGSCVSSPRLGADVALAQSIQVRNTQPPFAPDHLTISALAKNNSSDSSVTNVVVSFYDGDPAAGGALIDIESIGDLAPGASQIASVGWDLPGNIENHRIYAQVSFYDQANDPYPGNNSLSRPISVYYTDFRHDRDAYSFSNHEFRSFASLTDFLQFLADYDVPEQSRMLFIPQFGILTEIGGHCYGMSNSSLIYYEYPFLIPNPSKTTYELSIDEARAKIRTYQWYGIGPILEILMGLRTSDMNQQYQQTLDSIRQGKPVIHGLMNRSTDATSRNHAVVAYKIVDLGDEKRVFYYDNNLPLKNFPLGSEETYGVFNSSGFSEPFYSNDYDKAYVIEATPTDVDMSRILFEYLKWLFQEYSQQQTLSISLEGLADLLAVDAQGRRSGFIDGQKINEIPSSQVTGMNGGQALILPAGTAYTFTLRAVAETTGFTVKNSLTNTVVIFEPTSAYQARLVEFKDIAIPVGTDAVIQYALGQESYQINLPDGSTQEATTDALIEPPTNNIFLPLAIR